MGNVFVMLFLVSLLVLVVGLIKPSVIKLPNRKRVLLFAGGATLLFFVLIGTTVKSSPNNPAPKQEVSTSPTIKASNTPVATQVAVRAPTPPTTTASSTPTATPISFDKTKGNNYFAAQYSQKIKSSFDSTTPGFITAVYVQYDPEDIGGQSEYDYEKSTLQGAYITIHVNADSWDGMSDSLKKDFVAGLITTSKGNINVYPHVTVSDGFRTVAEGSWSVWSGDVNITLK